MSYALITGASKGIGKAIAVELAKRKYNLLLLARSADLLADLAHELKEKYGVETAHLAIDLAIPGADEKILQWCTLHNYKVNILVNNAGFGLAGPFDRYSREENAALIQVNISSLVQLCQAFLPMLKTQDRSYILNIASSSAYQSVPLLNLYSASKAFVLHFSRSLSHELKGTSVSVTAISPGPTDTDFPNRAQMNDKTKKTAGKLHMSPQAVALIAVNALFAGKREVVTGFVNKLGVFLVWLLPKGFIEKTASGIYK